MTAEDENKKERKRRPSLDRHGPYRFMGTVYRRSDKEAPKRPRTRGTLSSSEDVVIEAVKLGYKIADEQIAKGQDFARRLRGAAARTDQADVGHLVDQGVRLAKQIAVLLLEMAETSTQPQTVLRTALRNADEKERRERGPREDAGRHEPEPRPSAPIPVSVPIVVTSTYKTRVSLKLFKRLRRKPDVYPLYGTRNEGSLGDVRFEVGDAAKSYVLAVNVPAGTRPGTYRGYAIDPNDQHPLGIIEIEVSEVPETPPGRGQRAESWSMDDDLAGKTEEGT